MSSLSSPSEDRTSRRRILGEALGVSAIVTLLVTAASFLPHRFVAFAVAVVFLVATWVLVWRKDDATVTRHGLAFGGIVLPGKLDPPRMLAAALRAIGWTVAFAAITFPPFFLGWRIYSRPEMRFSLELGPSLLANMVLGQLAVIALPEEAFYRGYLQTRLGEAFARKIRVLGADLGPEVIIASIVFAIAHVATIRNPGRLAVFFPALLFGYLRARTGGVGAAMTFHAACNVFSEALGRGYGLY